MGRKYFLPFSRLTFHFVDGRVYCAEVSQFDVVLLLFVLFSLLLLVILVSYQKKSLPRSMSMSFSPLCSSNSFMILGLILKSSIHFELIFVSNL